MKQLISRGVIWVAVLGCIFLYVCRVNGLIDSTGFGVLLFGLGLVCLIVWIFPNIQTLSAKGGPTGVSLELEKIKEIKDEQDRYGEIQQKLQDTTVTLASLVAMVNTMSGRWSDQQINQLKREYVDIQLQSAVRNLEIKSDDENRIFALPRAFDAVDKATNDKDREKALENALIILRHVREINRPYIE